MTGMHHTTPKAATRPVDKALPLRARLLLAAIVLPFVAYVFFGFPAELPGGPRMHWSFLACLLLLLFFDDLASRALAALSGKGIAVPAWIHRGVTRSGLGLAPLGGVFFVDMHASVAVQALQWGAATFAISALLVLLHAAVAQLTAGLLRLIRLRLPG